MSQYSYLKRVEIKVEDLKIGMYVGKLDKPWRESSFLFQGFPIENQEQIEKLKRECRSVYIDFRTEQDYNVYLMTAGTEVEIEQKRNDIDLVQELPQASKIYKNSLDWLRAETDKIKLGGTPSLQRYQTIVTECIASLNRNPEALLILANIKDLKPYEIEHSLRVSLLAMAFGIHLGMSDSQLNQIGLSGLLFDIGKLRLPQAIINKPGKISREEAIVLKDHPKVGFRILNEINGLSDVVKEVALSHHERIDGRGYPRHIHKDRVSRYAKIISVIDTFDAITSKTPYSEARSPTHAFKLLVKNVDSKFDKEIVKSFCQWIGPAPVGSLVEMKTGEVGIVIKNRVEHPIKPRIMLITDEKKQEGFNKIIDLLDTVVHSSGSLYRLQSVLENKALGLRIEKYLDKESFDVPQWCAKSEIKSNSPFSKFL